MGRAYHVDDDTRDSSKPLDLAASSPESRNIYLMILSTTDVNKPTCVGDTL